MTASHLLPSKSGRPDRSQRGVLAPLLATSLLRGLFLRQVAFALFCGVGEKRKNSALTMLKNVWILQQRNELH